MESGDRIRVAREDEYTAAVRNALNQPSPVGMTGTVVEVRYNHRMGITEIFAKMDNDPSPNVIYVWDEDALELINE